MAVIKSNSVPH